MSIIRKSIEAGINYQQYRDLIRQLLSEGKTTGPDQSEMMVEYTSLNQTRMARIDKSIKLDPEVSAFTAGITRKLTFLVITEAWCGDASQIVPVISKLAALNDAINVVHVLRDEHEELMNQFLTNGAKSIPIIAIIDSNTFEVLGQWGPRPTFIQDQVIARKTDPNPTSYEDFVYETQKWYAKDRSKSIQKEFSETLSSVLNQKPSHATLG